MSEKAILTVSESPSHAVGLCKACDEIRSLMSEGKLIKAYEISLEGKYQGELIVSFPIDPKYNGKTIMLYHYAEEGREEQPVMVGNGKIEGKVKSLSPFAIVQLNEAVTQQVSLNQGESITIYPSSMNGTWTYDEKLIIYDDCDIVFMHIVCIKNNEKGMHLIETELKVNQDKISLNL